MARISDRANALPRTAPGKTAGSRVASGKSDPWRQGACEPSVPLRLLALLAVSYAGFGKTFAYLSVGPLYVGEAALVLITILLLLRTKITISGLRGSALLAASAIGGIQLVSQLAGAASPLEAVRNFAVIYYAWFAVLAYSAMRQHAATTTLPSVEQMRRLATAVLMALTFTTVVHFMFGAKLPIVPGSGVPAFSYKPTDAGIVLLVLLTLWLRHVLPTWSITLIAPQLLVAVAVSRSTLFCAVAVVLLVSRRSPRTWKFTSALAVALIVLTLTNATFVVNNREVSIRQIQANALSVLASDRGAGTDRSLSDNNEFRLRWWRAIVENASSLDAIFSGDGWETNLADKYGFQTSFGSQSELRHPHNVFVGLLGRAGWAVTCLFLFYMLAFVWRAAWALRFSQSLNQLVTLEVSLVVAIGGLINGSTDVYMESPQNAIPYWIVVGVGSFHLANLQRRSPSAHAPWHGKSRPTQ